jgi:hypothetical protein
MSTALKRPLAQAVADAEAFRALFPPQCFERWEIAGSVRRRKPEVGDVEHVIIPQAGEVEVNAGLFAERKTVNLLWHRLDEMLALGVVAKHVYGTGPTGAPLYRWGDKYRGVDYRGHMHETVHGHAVDVGRDPAHTHRARRVLGASRDGLLKNGGVYRQQEGRLVLVASGESVDVPDEETYVRLAGLAYVKPEVRA